MSAAPDPVLEVIELAAPPERVFTLLTTGLGQWWPATYSWAGDALVEILIEPRTGGHCIERGPRGFICHWGRVLDCRAPSLLRFTWQIAPDRTPVPDPAKASEVEIRLEPLPDGTALALEHRGFERHGEAAAEYRDGLASEDGWPYLLERLARVARP